MKYGYIMMTVVWLMVCVTMLSNTLHQRRLRRDVNKRFNLLLSRYDTVKPSPNPSHHQDEHP